MKIKSLQKSFTLIEMLIVIVIIGILAAALVPRLQAVQGRARDTKRKADFSQIRNGLAIYQTDNGIYPPTDDGIFHGGYNGNLAVYSHSGGVWIDGLQGILTAIPVDPQNVRTVGNVRNAGPRYAGNTTYAYGRNYKDGGAYTLVSLLENTKDPERCEVQAYQFHRTSSTVLEGCASFGGGNTNQLYIVTDRGP